MIFRAEPKNRIADEDWERYDGNGKRTLVKGLSAERESGLVFGAWNDIVVIELTDDEAKTIISKR